MVRGFADHYADAELLFGQYRSQIPSSSKNEPVICATKYCQFARVPAGEVIDREWVMRKVKARTDRVGGTVELLQVHWQYVRNLLYPPQEVHSAVDSKEIIAPYIGYMLTDLLSLSSTTNDTLTSSTTSSS